MACYGPHLGTGTGTPYIPYLSSSSTLDVGHACPPALPLHSPNVPGPPYQFTVYHSNSGFCTTSYLMIRCLSLDLRRRPGLKQAMADERNRQARQADFQHHQHSQGTCPGLPMNWRSTPSYHHSRLCSGSPRQRATTIAVRETRAASLCSLECTYEN